MLRYNFFLLLLLPTFLFAQNTDRDYAERLDQIETDAMELTYNSYVRAFINDFARNNKSYTSEALSRFERDESIISGILKSYGLPQELKYLALSLSGCSNFETSEEGGTGYYLMRYPIAKNKGLHISSYVDERRDMVKATHAMAKELKELHARYSDWHKAVAAYYASPLEVDRAISYSKDSLERYWAAHAYLPFRYQKTVSKLIASIYIHKYAGHHKIAVRQLQILPTDTVPIRQLTTIKQISDKLVVDYDLLKTLNPVYKRQIIPNSGRDYFLVLPSSSVNTFYALGDTVYLSEEELKDTMEQVKVEAPPQPEFTAVYYKVRSGDILMVIADYYDTRVSNIRRWNGIRGDRINIGQRLKIMVPTSKLSYYKKISGMSRSQKRRIANKD